MPPSNTYTPARTEEAETLAHTLSPFLPGSSLETAHGNGIPARQTGIGAGEANCSIEEGYRQLPAPAAVHSALMQPLLL